MTAICISVGPRARTAPGALPRHVGTLRTVFLVLDVSVFPGRPHRLHCRAFVSLGQIPGGVGRALRGCVSTHGSAGGLLEKVPPPRQVPSRGLVEGCQPWHRSATAPWTQLWRQISSVRLLASEVCLRAECGLAGCRTLVALRSLEMASGVPEPPSLECPVQQKQLLPG